ncbi:aminopeptidase N [Kineosporia sp. NBRC 101731]|uniref:aminopeptidase N n=1 Tax=Kineosporia sp. NBRC 101731 TaxID=3032199 RepID=UPI0024A2B4D6|nr:aminopeptidase N [Kineosporia sp. NBRC 101731]GLY30688.1 aminopeptidase [Kineosporia sp. NBRC 101731]
MSGSSVGRILVESLVVKSLTQGEAQERADLLGVERYEIAVDLTGLPTGPRVRTTSTITFSCRTPGAATFVDAAATVLGATLNGRALGPASGGRLPLDDLAAQNTLVVECEQMNTRDGAGVHKAVDPADGEVYLWTSFEPDQARWVWACFDQPDLKAPHTFTVTAPAEWTVTSNSGTARVSGTEGPEGSPGPRVWEFDPTPALSPYNTVVNAGPFHQVRRQVDGYDLGLLCRRSLASVLDREAEQLFTVTAQGLRFFGEQFEMPFPQARYDQVFVPEFGGAMENFGCVTWNDGFLRRSDPTPVEKEQLARVLLHEMAHMWFGNIVTMRWWDDLWLNESFAEFACNWAASEATEYTDAWARHLAAGKLAAYLADQGPVSHPIRQPIRDVAEATSIFDSITYPKGASVLRQLQVYVGEKAFRAGTAAYFAKYAWQNTTLQDLIDELAAASGQDLSAWRDGWLGTAGTDHFTLDTSGEQPVLVGRGPEGSPRPQVLAVGAYRSGLAPENGLTRTHRALVEVSSARTPLDLPGDADFYLVNDDDLTFATTRPADPAAAGRLPTPIARAVAVASLWDALVTGEMSAAQAVAGLVAVLDVETVPVLAGTYLNLAGDVAGDWAPAAHRAAIEAQVAEVARRLAAEPARRRAALRTLARVTGDPEALFGEVGDDIDLAWRTLVRMSELGGDTTAPVQDLLDRDPDPDSGMRAMTVRAAAPDPEAKATVWQALVDRSVPLPAIAAVSSAFWRPGQEAVLAGYSERYLALLPTLHRGGMIPALHLSRDLFPVFGIDEAYVARVTEAAAAGDVAPVVAKTLAERADEVARMLRTRKG